MLTARALHSLGGGSASGPSRIAEMRWKGSDPTPPIAKEASTCASRYAIPAASPAGTPTRALGRAIRATWMRSDEKAIPVVCEYRDGIASLWFRVIPYV